MNTLNRAATAHLSGSTDAYHALRAQWSAVVNSERRHALTAAHHLIYLALLGKDWRKAFTPITNRRKLENGAFYGWSLFKALKSLLTAGNDAHLLAPFGGLATPATLETLRKIIPAPNPYRLTPDQFAAGSFPFEAYDLRDFANAASEEGRIG